MCGMTTTFAHLAHFHLWAGTANQPFGLVLFLLTVGGLVVGALELVSPRGRWRSILRWIEHRENAVAAFLLVGLIAGWSYKIALMAGIVTNPALRSWVAGIERLGFGPPRTAILSRQRDASRAATSAPRGLDTQDARG
jgi:hypothetical protein